MFLFSETWLFHNLTKVDLPTGMSLLIFFAFALQCASTVAIVKRETKSWKWPIIQFIGMGAIAYLSAFLTFNLFQ